MSFNYNSKTLNNFNIEHSTYSKLAGSGLVNKISLELFIL